MPSSKGSVPISSVRVIKHLVLDLVLESGIHIELDCASMVHSGASLGLLDPVIFAGVQITPDGGLIWPNGHQVSAGLIADLIG